MAMSSYSRTATIVFLSSLVCLFVWMFVCPLLFLDSIHSTVTMYIPVCQVYVTDEAF